MSLMQNIRLESKLIYIKTEETVRRKFRKMLQRMIILGLSHKDSIKAIEIATAFAKFEQEHMPDCPEFSTIMQHYAHGLNQAAAEGLYLEFGTYKGKSMNIMGSLSPNTQFYCFDSFEGLPEDWHIGVDKGTFGIEGNIPDIRPNIHPVKGWFDQTLPKFAKQHENETIAFMHVDCDLYSSTKTIFDSLGHMIKPGTIILFDEYLSIPVDGDCEYKALMEFLAESGLKMEYIGKIRGFNQIATRIID